jgi:hypothetical protein
MTTTTGTTETTKTTENIRISAFCDTCDANDYGTKKELVSAGWEITANYHFCPLCAIG